MYMYIFFVVDGHNGPDSQKHAFGPFNLFPTSQADELAWYQTVQFYFIWVFV